MHPNKLLWGPGECLERFFPRDPSYSLEVAPGLGWSRERGRGPQASKEEPGTHKVPEGEVEFLEVAYERGSGFLVRGGERDRETHTHRTCIFRDRERERRPREGSTKRERGNLKEGLEEDLLKSYKILKFQSEQRGFLPPFWDLRNLGEGRPG